MLTKLSIRHTPPTFIVGCPHSGTTALAYAISRRNFLFTNELCLLETPDDLFNRLDNALPGLMEHKNLNTVDFKGLCDIFTELPFMEYVYVVYELLQYLDLYQGIDIFQHAKWQATDGVEYPSITPGPCDGMIWGDKFPQITADPGFHDWAYKFPLAKIIYMQRDGRDVLAGHFRTGTSIDDANRLWEIWVKCYKNISSLREHSVLWIRQEHLLQDPDGTVERINRFFGRPVLLPGDCRVKIKRKSHEGALTESTDPADVAKYAKYREDVLAWHRIPTEAQELLLMLGYTKE